MSADASLPRSASSRHRGRDVSMIEGDADGDREGGPASQMETR